MMPTNGESLIKNMNRFCGFALNTLNNMIRILLFKILLDSYQPKKVDKALIVNPLNSEIMP